MMWRHATACLYFVYNHYGRDLPRQVSTEIFMTKYRNRFRIESTRIPEYDYSNPNWYYVTINTKNHICYFGNVSNGKMKLNELGKIVEKEWLKNADLRKSIELDYFIIMPNHLHGIIVINPQLLMWRMLITM